MLFCHLKVAGLKLGGNIHFRLNLDLFDISAVMASPVQCIQSRESVQVLANVLLSTNHGGFPVVRTDLPGFSKTFLGMITRFVLWCDLTLFMKMACNNYAYVAIL